MKLEFEGKTFQMKNGKTALFIDGGNLFRVSRNLDFDIDYKKLLEFFNKKGNILRAHYYAAILETAEYSPLKPLTDWLSYNGYFIVTKAAKEYTDSTGKRNIKGDMSVDITVDMMELAHHVDTVILFAGDNDYRRPVEYVQRKGVKVIVVSSMKAGFCSLGDDLRRQADEVIELADIAGEISRKRETSTHKNPEPIRG